MALYKILCFKLSTGVASYIYIVRAGLSSEYQTIMIVIVQFTFVIVAFGLFRGGGKSYLIQKVRLAL